MWYVRYVSRGGVRRQICFYDVEAQAKHFAKLANGEAYKEGTGKARGK